LYEICRGFGDVVGLDEFGDDLSDTVAMFDIAVEVKAPATNGAPRCSRR
jgi:hypothetical protein